MNDSIQALAFKALAGIFVKYEPAQELGDQRWPVLTIEVLPKSIEPPEGQLLLEDEEQRSIGVPKKVLMAAFLYARNIFMSASVSERASKTMTFAIRIILLYDPEFVTAANARKKYLLSISPMRPGYNYMRDTSLTRAVHDELWFLTSILSSPLHRQSKSPTLWWQRAWIARTFASDCENLFNLAWVSDELDVVLKAAEMHQHNYYAFQYARRVLNTAMLNAMHDPNLDQAESADATKAGFLAKLLTWCKAHPSDTSGWSFLSYWLEQHHDPAQKDETIRAILKFALSIEWKGEALWVFLRNTVCGKCGIAITNANELSIEIHDAIINLCPRLARSSEQIDRAPAEVFRAEKCDTSH